MKPDFSFEYIVLGIAALCLIALGVFAIADMANDKAIAAEYPSEFISVIDDCGEHASYAINSIASFQPGKFLDCLSEHHVTFALNGDTVKASK